MTNHSSLSFTTCMTYIGGLSGGARDQLHLTAPTTSLNFAHASLPVEGIPEAVSVVLCYLVATINSWMLKRP